MSENAGQTRKFAQALAKRIERGRKRALVLALQGDLGGGKTTFAQGLARGLGVKDKILSPTFVLMRKFKVKSLKPERAGYFYHIDCYRIQKPDEVLGLGWKEIISNPQNIVVIEWAEKIKKLLPRDAFWLKFEYKDKNKRRITVL